MSYPLHVLRGEPRFDALPVLKLRCGREVPVNERMFAQAQLGLTDSCFFARLWAFETAPAPQSCLSVHVAGPNGVLVAEARATGDTALHTPNGDRSALLTAYGIRGEDLQGIYWGAVLMVPVEIFTGAVGLKQLLPTTIIKGNVLKEHPGTSAAFGEDAPPRAPDAFGDLRVVFPRQTAESCL